MLGHKAVQCSGCGTDLCSPALLCRELASARMQLRSLIGPAEQRYSDAPALAQLQAMHQRVACSESRS